MQRHTITADIPLLDIDSASVVRGGRLILDTINLQVAGGEHTAILGPNGAGKSTLIKLIARQLYPLARADGTGRVHVFGRERWNVTELRGLLGIVSPALERDYTTEMPLEVFDAVVSSFFAARGLWLNHHATDAMRERSRVALAQVGASHLVGRQMADLSTGEARRVLIARALVHRPRLLLLDEPSAGLDLGSRRHFLETLRGLALGGTTLLVVTHHIEEVLPEVRQVVLLKDGRIWKHGAKEQTLTGATLSAAFGIPIELRRHGAWYQAAVA